MRKKYPVVTLCGSTRFKNEFLQIQKELTLDGYIVLSVGLFGHAGDCEVWEGLDENTLTQTKMMLDDMHKEKIRMADSIFVVNPNGYIGNSTWSEICYAKMLHKEIQFMCPIETDLIDSMVDRHIREAERLAWQQLDGIRHTYGDSVEGYVYFKHKRKIILDPWISLEAHYGGSPWADHEDPEQAVNPFEYYGYEKVAWITEQVRCDFKELLNVLQPKIVICLGKNTFIQAAKIYNHKNPLIGTNWNEYLNSDFEPIKITVDSHLNISTFLYPMAHPGYFGILNRNGKLNHEKNIYDSDWERLGTWMEKNSI